jgi:hypothetical protein
MEPSAIVRICTSCTDCLNQLRSRDEAVDGAMQGGFDKGADHLYFRYTSTLGLACSYRWD